MICWTISNQKGGVGKTTTTVALAGQAINAGLRVLMVDLDPQGSLSAYFGLDPDRQELSTFTLFSERKLLSRSTVTALLASTQYDDLYLMPASTGLATLERQGIGDGMGLVLTRALAFLKKDFDLVVMDCPPQLGVLMVNALAACDQLIVPVQTEFLAIKGLERMLHTLSMLARSTKRELPYLIVPTMFDRRTQACVGSLRTIRNNFGDGVWAGRIPIDTRLRDASRAGILPQHFDPRSRGAEAYSRLYQDLMDRHASASTFVEAGRS